MARTAPELDVESQKQNFQCRKSKIAELEAIPTPANSLGYP